MALTDRQKAVAGVSAAGAAGLLLYLLLRRRGPKYTLTISTTAGGTTDPLPGAYLILAGTVSRVTAIPDSSHAFDRWDLDGAMRTENPINVQMNSDHALSPYFNPLPGSWVLSFTESFDYEGPPEMELAFTEGFDG